MQEIYFICLLADHYHSQSSLPRRCHVERRHTHEVGVDNFGPSFPSELRLQMPFQRIFPSRNSEKSEF
ncbi:hypothetical protein LDENG_00055750 [Lucifuga dentata]|nr:hypothetical protein LDENG_00055750 [Lucifuga dentata]